MNMIGKFSTSLVAIAAFSAIIFASTSADAMKPAQSATVVAAADASQSRVEPLSYPSFNYPYVVAAADASQSRVEPLSYPYAVAAADASQSTVEPLSYPSFNYPYEFTLWVEEPACCAMRP
jgi:hypothetical protein